MGLLFDFVTHNNGSCGQYALATPTPTPTPSCSLHPCLAWHFRCETAFLLCGLIFLMPTTLCWLPGSPPAWPPAPPTPPRASIPSSEQRRVQLNIIVKNKTTARSPTVAACQAAFAYCSRLPFAVAVVNPLLPPFSLSLFCCRLLLLIVHSGNCLLTRRHTYRASVCVCVCWPTARQFVFSLSGQLKAF